MIFFYDCVYESIFYDIYNGEDGDNGCYGGIKYYDWWVFVIVL